MMFSVVEFDPNNFAQVFFPSCAAILLALLAWKRWMSGQPSRVVAEANKLLQVQGGVVDHMRTENERLAAQLDALQAKFDALQQEMRDTLGQSASKIAQLKWQVEEGARDRKVMAKQISAQNTHIDRLEASMTAAGIAVPPRPF